MSLYRGMGTVVMIGTPAFVMYLATYEATKKKLVAHPALKNYEFVGHFISGMVAETVRYALPHPRGMPLCFVGWKVPSVQTLAYLVNL